MSANKNKLLEESAQKSQGDFSQDDSRGLRIKPFSTDTSPGNLTKRGANNLECPYSNNFKQKPYLFSDEGRIFAPKRQLKELSEFDLKRKENYDKMVN